MKICFSSVLIFEFLNKYCRTPVLDFEHSVTHHCEKISRNTSEYVAMKEETTHWACEHPERQKNYNRQNDI